MRWLLDNWYWIIGSAIGFTAFMMALASWRHPARPEDFSPDGGRPRRDRNPSA